MKNASVIVGYINETLKGYSRIGGELTEERAHKIIRALTGDMIVNDPVTKEVMAKMKKFYNFEF